MDKWSFTKIDTFAFCLQKGNLRYNERIYPKQKAKPLALGACIASGLEGYRQGVDHKVDDQIVYLEKGTFEAASTAFMQKWEADGKVLEFWKKEDPKRSVERGLEILDRYVKEYPNEHEMVLKPEIRFEEKIAPGIIYTGVIDSVMEDEIGPFIIEDKTASWEGPVYRKEKVNGNQILWYLVIAHKLGLFDIKPNSIPRAVLNVIYIHEKTYRFPREPIQKFTRVLKRAEKNLLDWIYYIKGVIERGIYPHAEYAVCQRFNGCEYLPLCNASEKTYPMILKGSYTQHESAEDNNNKSN